ncbi:MAG: SDR family oxidoreductase [Candidatus Omnitrophica bacterium]|nr:SDR family oxidoreductase [Candidatus Omnitrophota bacterium]
MKKILITGVSGLLGSNLAFCYRDRYELLGLYRTHRVDIEGMRTMECDINDKDMLDRIIQTFQPDIIIHCAALSRPDICERDPDLTYQINVQGTGNILAAIAALPTKLVYISTDAIFDGERGHYREEDQAVAPHCYGKSKLEAEQQVLQRPDALVLRINIYGWNVIIDQKSFGEHVIASLSTGQEMKGMTDAFCSIMYTFDLAKLIEETIDHGLTGIYHSVCSDYCSKYDYILKAAKQFGLSTEKLKACHCDDFGFQVPRAKNLMLNVSKLEQALGHPLPTVDESIADFHQDYLNGVPDQMKACMVTYRECAYDAEGK